MAEVNEIVQAIDKKLSEHKSAFDVEREKAQKEAKEVEVKLQKEVDELKDIATKQGATILQLQEVEKEHQIKRGRQKMTGGTISGRGAIKSLESAIYQSLAKESKALEALAAGGDRHLGIELKLGDILDSSFTTTNAYPYNTILDWRPGMEPTGQIRFRDLVRTIPSQFDAVLYPRANSPVGAGSFGKQTTEGAAKAQVDRGYTMIALQLYAFAGYAIVSRQALRNIVFLQGWLPTSMNEQLMDSEDIDFGTALSAAATGSTSTTGAGTAFVEKIIFLVKNLIQTKFQANAIAMNPGLWASLLITKPNDYSLPNVVTIDTAGTVRILGMPVYPVNWLGGNRVIVGDWTKAAMIESEGMTFRTSDAHASTFIANEITFLLERTEGLAIFRPDAFVSAGL